MFAFKAILSISLLLFGTTLSLEAKPCQALQIFLMNLIPFSRFPPKVQKEMCFIKRYLPYNLPNPMLYQSPIYLHRQKVHQL